MSRQPLATVDTSPVITIPRHEPFPGWGGRFDTFRATSYLKSVITGERILLDIEFVRNAARELAGAVYRIVSLGSKQELAVIPIANDREAAHLYHRFRALNPEFRPE